MEHKTNRLSGFVALGFALLLFTTFGACADGGKAAPSSTALEKAKKIKVSDVKYDGLPLGMVITMLREECLKRDPAGKGLNIALGPDAKQFEDTQNYSANQGRHARGNA